MDASDRMADRRNPMSWDGDLQLLLVAVGALWAVTLLPVIRDTPLRILVAVPFALFVPGYALIAALFPERVTGMAGDQRSDSAAPSESSGLDTLERAVLSFGASIVLVPLVGLVLNVTPWGIRLPSILTALTALTLPLTAFAARRRAALPTDERYTPAIRDTAGATMGALTDTGERTDTALTAILLVSALLAVGSVGYAVTGPADGGSFTEFSLLTEDESGDPVADEYPESLTTGTAEPLVVRIGNHEGEPTNYTVVAELQHVRRDGNRTVVTDRVELDQFTRGVAANETVTVQRRVVPRELTGSRLRLQFRLYRGGGPSEGHHPEPYRETHLWVSVADQA